MGAGPAGALAAYRLARDGARVSLLDASHPREKPCGGAMTARSIALLPPAPPDDPLPGRRIGSCRFESGSGDSVAIEPAGSLIVVARRDLDGWLLRRAVDAGATHVSERVVAVDASGGLRTTAGREHAFDFLVGADGAGSLVRRTFLGPTPPGRLMMAAGWFVEPGRSPMVVRFAPDLAGYLWLFPRPDHVAVGIGAPLGALPTRELLSRLEREVRRSFPELAADGHRRYAHTIPSPTADARSILEIAGPRWALVGDAAALADPITGEGICAALESSQLLSDTLREDGTPLRYPQRVLESFGRDLMRAARLQRLFYAPGLVGRLIAHTSRSPRLRALVTDILFGDHGHAEISARLWEVARRLAWDKVS